MAIQLIILDFESFDKGDCGLFSGAIQIFLRFGTFPKEDSAPVDTKGSVSSYESTLPFILLVFPPTNQGKSLCLQFMIRRIHAGSAKTV